MPTKNEIIAALLTLKPDELRAVHAVTASLLGAATGAKGVPLGTLAGPVIDAMGNALGHNIRVDNLPPTLVKQLEVRIVAMTSFFDNHFSTWNQNKTVRTAFLRFMMGLLHKHLLGIGVPPSYKTMILSLNQMPAAFDHQFPNYRQSGMGNMIVDKFK